MKKFLFVVILVIVFVVALIIGSNIRVFGYAGGQYEAQLKCFINVSKIFVNGCNIDKGQNNKINCITVDGTTYVPLRKISENLDCQVIYDKNTKFIYIDKIGEELNGW